MLALLPMLAVFLSALVMGSDFYARRVPNTWLLAVLLVAIAFMATSTLQGQHPQWLTSLLGMLLGLVVMLPFYAIGWMGAGDVKFFATLGFLLGYQSLLSIWVIGCLLTGVHALAVVLSRHKQLAFTSDWLSAHLKWHSLPVVQASYRARQGRKGLPHAAYLAIGTLVTVYANGFHSGVVR